ncbi:lysozyme [Shewanella acanthi]|uniref:lysozyme n=1 Tax=Shewanella acanthi TaxID=2864212 RepID=UPI001C65A117|nr:lysozyme [Shewanella acanthi]QYJ79417.1 lysozyme [Shewanella acanthi]
MALSSSTLKQRLVALGLSVAVSLAGAALIAPAEAPNGQPVQQTYLDPAGIITACFGHTGPELERYQFFSEQQCIEMFAKDLGEADKQLRRLTYPVQLTEGEHAAYLSLIYNFGSGTFQKSTLRKLLLKGERVAACKQLTQACGKYGCNGFVYAGGYKLQGLVNRRAQEQAICLKDLYVE